MSDASISEKTHAGHGYQGYAGIGRGVQLWRPPRQLYQGLAFQESSGPWRLGKGAQPQCIAMSSWNENSQVLVDLKVPPC